MTQEDPEKLERNELKGIVYIWHQQTAKIIAL